jgi:hypothetical protein
MMKNTLLSFISLIFLLGISYLSLQELPIPFKPLPERVRLISYANYSAIGAGSFLFSVCFALSLYWIFIKPSDEIRRLWGVRTCLLTILVAIGCFIPRYYLGKKVDEANYVKCVKESRTSSKSSWRVYAKSIDLCKDSKGFVGG